MTQNCETEIRHDLQCKDELDSITENMKSKLDLFFNETTFSNELYNKLISLKESLNNDEYFNLLNEMKSHLNELNSQKENDCYDKFIQETFSPTNIELFRDISIALFHSSDFLKLCISFNLNFPIISFFTYLSHTELSSYKSNSSYPIYKYQKLNDYEDMLFILSDYLSKTQETSYLFLKSSSENNIVSLFPVFSLVLHNLSKTNKLPEAELLLGYLMHNNIEISTCAINNFIDSLCKVNELEKAQSIFEALCEYKPIKVFPENSYKFNKYILGQGVNIVTYGTFIKWLCKNGNMELALYYYKILKDKERLKDEIIYNLIIDGCSKKGDLETIADIYYQMLNNSIKPTIVTFNTIIDAYVRAKDLTSAWKIFEDLLKNDIQPDNFTLSTLFRGIRCPNHKDYLLRGLELVNQFNNTSSDNNHSNFNQTADIILINVLLDSCIALKESTLIIELFNNVTEGRIKKVKPDLITYNTFIKGCAQMNLFNEVLIAFEKMCNDPNIKPNDVTFNTLIDVFVRSKDMNKVWFIISKMKETGIKPDNFTYSTIIKGLNKNTNLNCCDNNSNSSTNSNLMSASSLNTLSSSSGNDNASSISNDSELDLAFKLFDNVRKTSQPDEILYNCIMDACLRFHKVDKALELYDNMLTEGIKPSSITCGIVIKAYGMIHNVTKALAMYEEMKRNKIEISSVTYGCLINACIQNNDNKQAFALYEELKENNYAMNTILYTTLIKAYTKEKKIDKVIEILDTMKTHNDSLPNNITYNSVIDCCLKCERFELADDLFNEMCSLQTVKPDIITFSTLIKGALRNKNFEQTMSYFNKMLEMNIKPDDVFLNSLLDGCEKMCKFKEGISIFEKIKNLGVEPSMMSYSIMMKILGKLNNFEYSNKLIKAAKKTKQNFNLIMFTCYIKTCLSTKHIKEAIESFNELEQFGIAPDDIAYNTMINGICRNGYNEYDYSQCLYDLAKKSVCNGVYLIKKQYINVLKYIKGCKHFDKANELGKFLENHKIIEPRKQHYYCNNNVNMLQEKNETKQEEQELNVNTPEYIPLKKRNKMYYQNQQQSKKENVSNQGNVNYNERNPFNSLWERSKNNKNVNYVNAFNEDTGTNYNTNKKYNNDNTKQYYFNQKDNYNQRHFYTYNIFDKTILNNPLHFNGFNYNNMNTMFKNQNKNYTSQSDNDNINSSSNQCLYPNAV